jgi:7,8-dihydropterin-6-yl-methyl-4-(beta-D-ribofuranosyl)aminobenzene 5'-phosphate synthase
MDERYVVVDVVGKGPIIFSTCAGFYGKVRVCAENSVCLLPCGDRERSGAAHTHGTPSMRPTFHAFLTLYRTQIIGDLQFASPELRPRIAPTIAFLSQALMPAPTYGLPMHRSGFGIKCALEGALSAGCVPAGVGMRIVVQAVEAEAALNGRLVGHYEGMDKGIESR